MDTQQLTQIVLRALSILTLIGGIWSIATILLLIISAIRRKKPIKWVEMYLLVFSKKAYVGAFVVTLLAMSGSLYFSEVAHFTPCMLCWYQRILMYPQAILTLVSLIQRRRNITCHLMTLSTMGAIIATFHYYEQITNTQIVTCSVVGISASCSEKFFLQLGYITIPMMALTAFVMVIVLMTLSKRLEKKRRETLSLASPL